MLDSLTKKNLYYFIILVIFLSLIFVTVNVKANDGNDDPVVTFNVQDEDGNPLDGAHVEVWHHRFTTTGDEGSTKDGEISFELIPHTYEYIITLDGYQKVSNQVNVEGEDVDVTITLKESVPQIVTFNIKDESKNFLDGAKIRVYADKEDIYSNKSEKRRTDGGKAKFELHPDDYKYFVSLDGYKGEYGKFDVESEPVRFEKYLTEVNPNTYSIGLIADSHYADLSEDPRGSRFYRSAIFNTAVATEVFNIMHNDFIVHLGDVIQEARESEISKKYLQDYDHTLLNFDGNIHYAVGNHDLEDFTKEEFLEYTSGFKNETYYSFDKEGFRFLIVDPNYRPDGEPYSRGNFDYTDCYIPEHQREWIRDELEKAKELGKKACLFMHQPIKPASVNNGEEVRTILEEAGNVAAVFQGHHHPESGVYNIINDIPYILISGMLNHAEPTFAVITIDPEAGKIVIDGYGAQNDFEFELVN